MRDLQQLLEKQDRHRNERRYYVYTYAYPNGMVFYVGKGTGNRINRHEDEARRNIQSAKCATIREIWARGKQVVKQKIREHLTSEEAFALERDLILHYGIESLTNILPERAIPQEESIIPANICLYKDFRSEIEASIKQCMMQDGIELSSHACHEYLQEICIQAIRIHIN